jgi:hypothetical protein
MALSADKGRRRVALAWIDISTGQFRIVGESRAWCGCWRTSRGSAARAHRGRQRVRRRGASPLIDQLGLAVTPQPASFSTARRRKTG